MANALVRLARRVRDALPRTKGHIQTVSENRGGWFGWPWIREPFSGAWQRNIEWTVDTVLAHHAVYACITLIASDMGKMRPKLVELDDDGIWTETKSAAFLPVLRKPNRFQNHIQFKEWWAASKLIRGNTYALKDRDARGVVTALYILDPSRVQVLVAPDGAVFYKLGQDNLTGIEDVSLTVPASEIIHDRINCLFHPLVGVSPLFACGLAATIGLNIERNAAAFFANGSNPSGLLIAPTPIDDATAKRLSDQWNAMYSGDRSGRIAVMGNNLQYTPLRMTAVESQMIEQLKWTAENVCSAFHVPPFKIGIGSMPTYQNGEVLNQIYYSDCLQSHIEQYELAMDEGLGIGIGVPKDGRTFGVELDLDALLRMDTATQYKTLGEGIKTGLIAPNEGRRKIDLKPVAGGDTPYLQQQNFSLAALDERDRNKPFEKPVAPEPPVAADDVADEDEEMAEDEERSVFAASINMRLLGFAAAQQTKLLEVR
jgi:HK97 family phage portal protein